MKYEIKPTEDLYTLNKFFEENDLEIGDEDEPEKTDPVAAWNVVDTKGMAGGILLALCEGEYILDGIAVRENLREKTTPSSSKTKWALPIRTFLPLQRETMPWATAYSTSECSSRCWRSSSSACL